MNDEKVLGHSWNQDLGGFVRGEKILDWLIDNNPILQAHTIGAQGVPNPATNPMQAYRYTYRRRQTLIASNKQRPLIRIFDKNMKYIGKVSCEKSVEWEEMMNSAGPATINLRRNNWLMDWLVQDVASDEDVHITIDPRRTKRHWSTRWGGKVTAAHIKRTSEGMHEIELECISNWEHWRHLLFGANPILPPEAQLPKMFILAMNTRSLITTTATINLARNYIPALSIFTNIANPGAWLIPIVDSEKPRDLLNISPLNWPVQMAFVNIALDQSRFAVLASRWTDAAAISDPLLKDAGCFMRPYTFLHGEDQDTPHTELADIVGNDLAMPSRSCVVFGCLNKSGVTGPTGTAADGVINLVAATADDLITELIFPVDADGDGVTDPLFRKWLGVAPAKAKVIFRDNEYSGIIDADRSMKKFVARTIMIGGKSPGWVNEGITFAIRYGLSQLAQVINYGLGAYEQPGVEGLDNLYQGQLDDTVLAFERYTDPKRVIKMGIQAFLEHMESAGGSAYTVSGIIQLRQGHWKTRAYIATKVNVLNGYPWIVYEDFELGDRLAFEISKILYTDQCSSIKWSYSDSAPLLCGLGIGTDGDEEDPFARGIRAVQAVWSAVGMLLGDGGSTF